MPLRYRIRFWLAGLRMDARKFICRVRGLLTPAHIHSADDGRGVRQAYVDGVPVKRVVFADTRKGVVRLHHDPIKVCRRREVARTYKLRGVVEVFPVGGRAL